MADLSFLPAWPPENWELALFAGLLLVGFAAGELLRRLYLPRLTGYLLIGLALGESGLGLIDTAVLRHADVLVEAGLGLLLFELGQRLDLDWLRHEPWLWFTSLGEIVLTWGLVFGGLVWFGFTPLDAALLGALAICTSPLIVMALVREHGADGQVSNRALTLTALNSLASFVLLAMLLAPVHLEYSGSWPRVGLHPLYLLAGSLALGGAMFLLLLNLARWLGKDSSTQFALAIGVVLLGVGAALSLKLPVLGAMLTLGLLVKNADPRRHIRHIDFGSGMELFFVTLFIAAGATARLAPDLAVLQAALLLIGLRFIGKSLPVLGFAALTPLGLRRAGLLCLTLTPLSGFAALLVIDTTRTYPQLSPAVVQVTLTAVLLLELAGSVLAHIALTRSGEGREES